MAEVMNIPTQAAAAGGPPDPPRGPPEDRRPPEGEISKELQRELTSAGPSDYCHLCKRRHWGPCKFKCEMCKKRHLGRCKAVCKHCYQWGHHHSVCKNEQPQRLVLGLSSGGDRDLGHRMNSKAPQGTLVLLDDWTPGEDGPNTKRNRRKRAERMTRRRNARDRRRAANAENDGEEELEDAEPKDGPHMTPTMRPLKAEASEGDDATDETGPVSESESKKETHR